MILCRVTGNIVSTIKHPSHQGHKTMIVQPVDEEGQDTGKSFLAHDKAQSGPGDLVLVEQEGNCARELLGNKTDPFHAVIVGIVDKVQIKS